jgi:hypothetical protein
MQVGHRWVVCVASALVLAGCAGSAKQPAATDEPALEDLRLVATATTGIVRGVVVDDAIRPIANATIDLAGNGMERSTRTTPAGAFGFQDLPGGSYFLKVSKVGYFGAQQTAAVVAGEANPAVVKVQLRIDVANLPYVQGQTFDGYIECTTSFLVLCGAPNLVSTIWCQDGLEPIPPACLGNFTNDRFTNDFYFADNASMIQFEMVWESNQGLSPEMYFELEELDGNCTAPAKGSQYEGVSAFNNTHGKSPIYATVNATQIAAWKIGTACPIYFSVFSGGATGVPCDPVATGWCVGATLEQRFTLVVHDFHGFLPPVGWRFTKDGLPPVPT